MNKNQLFRKIPKMNVLLTQEMVQGLIDIYGYDVVLDVLRREQEKIRLEIAVCTEEKQAEACIETFMQKVEEHLKNMYRPHLKKALNGTGTILHTNLGRAPLPTKQAEEALREVSGYSNLEYDLANGVRGNRTEIIEKLLCEITGAESAVAVNNNAAAVLLVLNSLARDGEVVVSRGELVEVGGRFRIPEVIELGGAKLKEVGTTNRTNIKDYENAITENTKAFLKVHTSNYQIVGFTESVSTEELGELSGRSSFGEQKIPVVEDLGSGALVDLRKYGLPGEPVVRESLKRGADIVCFSGDKLLGGPQAGIIVGRKCYVDRMRFNPFYRAVRIDKLTAAILERVLTEYRFESRAIQNIPVLRMITKKIMDVEQDAKKLKRMLKRAAFQAEAELYPCESQIGGGSLPQAVIPSMAVAIVPTEISVEELERRMRKLPIPVIGRIEKGKLLLDMRTFEIEYASKLIAMLKETDTFLGNKGDKEQQEDESQATGSVCAGG